jgi:probable HAF family extracellular repeat protein
MKRCLTARLFAAVFSAGTAQAAAYHVVDLGVPAGFTDSAPAGVNDAGLVIGTAFPNDHAFQWDAGGGFVLLDPLPGGTASGANAVNGDGVVVGFSNQVFAPRLREVRWTAPDSPVVLGTQSADTDGSAVAVNSFGEAVGQEVSFGIPIGTSTALFWDIHGNFTQISTDAAAAGINDDGAVVGSDALDLFTSSAYVWTEADGKLPFTGLESSMVVRANDINDAGVTVGSSDTNSTGSDVHAVRWIERDAPLDLGALATPGSSEALALNEAGTVVGATDTNSGRHAMVWTDADGMLDLNDVSDAADLGLTLDRATAVNASGQIAGLASIGGHSHGFLATPVPETTSTAPVWFALAALLRRRRRRPR